MKHLAEEYVTLYRSPSPHDVYCYSPALLKLPTGRLLATMDIGGWGVGDLYPDSCTRRPKRIKNGQTFNSMGIVLVSDDGGQTWQEKHTAPMMFMRPFSAGDTIYIMGAARDLGIMKSTDNGETWSPVTWFSEGELWHQAPCNVWYKDDCVYLVWEKMVNENKFWPIGAIAPILMRGKVTDDLMQKENWTFASELVYEQEFKEEDFDDFGVPFYPRIPGGYHAGSPLGWLETNVVQLKKEDDWLYDPTGKTLHLFARTWSGGPAWMGALLKVVENDDGTMTTMFETAPSGKKLVFIPIPGGGWSKFHMMYDEPTKTYWLLTNEFPNSMVNLNKMDDDYRNGYGRNRLVLYYSYNCFDWLFGGVVATGKTPLQSRSYAYMEPDGDDLLIASRSGDEQVFNGHETNLISLHRVKNFRELIDEDCVL